MKVKFIWQLPWHIIWIMTLLESVTVPLLVSLNRGHAPIMQAKSILNGFIVGMVGTAVVVSVCLLFLRVFDIRFRNHRITTIYPFLTISLWGGLLLATLFFLENVFNSILSALSTFLANMLVAFFSMYFTMLVVMKCYHYLAYFRVYFAAPPYDWFILQFSIFPFVLLTTLYETIALPLIWQIYDWTHSALLGGFCGGLIGSSFVYVLSRCLYKNRLYLIIEKA
jgi:hypothetical protein